MYPINVVTCDIGKVNINVKTVPINTIVNGLKTISIGVLFFKTKLLIKYDPITTI